MNIWVVVAVLLFLLFAGFLAAVALRRQRPPPPVPAAEPEEQDASTIARHELLEQRGTELLQRRVDLDARRGTLGGNTEVYEAFERLEADLRAGTISESEFEQEKVRLLGG
jgi:hypothetical protein